MNQCSAAVHRRTVDDRVAVGPVGTRQSAPTEMGMKKEQTLNAAVLQRQIRKKMIETSNFFAKLTYRHPNGPDLNY